MKINKLQITGLLVSHNFSCGVQHLGSHVASFSGRLRTHLASDEEEVHVAGEVHGQDERHEALDDGDALVPVDDVRCLGLQVAGRGVGVLGASCAAELLVLQHLLP